MSAASLASVSLSILLSANFPADDPKRENPRVLAPTEFRTAVDRTGIRSYMFSVDHREIFVRYEKPKSGIAWVSVDQLEKRSDVRLIDKVLPVRMVMVVSSFPYRKQLEEVRRALHLATLEEAQTELAFAGFEIERRPMRADGKPGAEWDKGSIREAHLEVVRASGRRFEREESALEPVIFRGLVYALPERLDGARYASPDAGLPLLTKTLEKIGSPRQKISQDAEEENPFGRKVEKETKKANFWAIPEYCLLRFVDVTVEPGQSYQYRFKVRMRNPNFKRDKNLASPELAKSEFLFSDWVYVSGQIRIPSDFAFYAVDQQEVDPFRYSKTKAPAPDQAVVQLQRWIDIFDEGGIGREPVGEWAVADRVLIHAGEYIGGNHEVELPVWHWLEERFVLASSPADRQKKRIVIPFTEDHETAPVLVSFNGGEIRFNGIQEQVPREVLVLMPNGRLAMRNSVVDEQDPDRREHYQHWRGQVDQIKRIGSGRR
jgi:hypothetical protein